MRTILGLFIWAHRLGRFYLGSYKKRFLVKPYNSLTSRVLYTYIFITITFNYNIIYNLYKENKKLYIIKINRRRERNKSKEKHIKKLQKDSIWIEDIALALAYSANIAH